MSLLNRGRLRKLLRHWRRPGALVNCAGTRAAYRLKRLTVPSLPTHLDIEPINACNLRCAHCHVPHSEKETVRLPKSAFGSLLDELGGPASVKLQGMGEPFLNDELVPMLKQGEARGVSMRVVSNGTLCHGETIDGLLELSDTEVTFSLDGASAEVFEAIRPGANFDGVCANIRALVQRRGERRQPLIGVAAVMTRRNAHEVVEIVTLAGRLGVDGIVLRPTLGNWGKESMKPHTDPIRLRWSEAAPILEQARAFANERGIDLAVYRPEWLWAKAVCPWPWTSAFIAANGDVVPCCRVSDPDTVCMGNVFEESFARIWNSREYQSLRDRLRNHDPPGFCINCQAAGREDESNLACEPGPTGEPPQ